MKWSFRSLTRATASFQISRSYSDLRILNTYELIQNLKKTQATDILMLRNLESNFIYQLPKITQGQYLCNLLRAFLDKNLNFYPDSITKIEEKLLDPKLDLNLTDIHHILMTLNQSAFYGRVSEQFLDKFTDRVLEEADKIPIALLMSYMAQTGFYSQKAFQTCSQLWKEEMNRNFKRDVFREGFCALANTDFMDEGTYLWSRDYILRRKDAFNSFDVVHILRSYILMNQYDYEIFDTFIDRIRFKLYNNFSEKEKCVLHQIFISIQIDKPIHYEDLCGKLLSYKSEISACYRKNKYQSNSITQDTLAKFLREQRIQYKEMEIIHDFYEADFFIPDKNTVVELMGWNYHISQYTKQLNKSTLLKLRHLKAIGYKVLIVSSLKDMKTRIPLAFEILKSQSETTAVHILDSEIKINF